MELALEEAYLSASLGEVPVGALVVAANGEILARAGNRCISLPDPTAHAELLALREAALKRKTYRLSECFLVVSLEPCLMCVGAALHARIAGIVWGAPEPVFGAISSRLDALNLNLANHNKIWELGGILEARCKESLSEFFAKRR